MQTTNEFIAAQCDHAGEVCELLRQAHASGQMSAAQSVAHHACGELRADVAQPVIAPVIPTLEMIMLHFNTWLDAWNSQRNWSADIENAYQCAFRAGWQSALEANPIRPQPVIAPERNFCERCGKRLGSVGHIHTCTPPEPL